MPKVYEVPKWTKSQVATVHGQKIYWNQGCVKFSLNFVMCSVLIVVSVWTIVHMLFSQLSCCLSIFKQYRLSTITCFLCLVTLLCAIRSFLTAALLICICYGFVLSTTLNWETTCAQVKQREHVHMLKLYSIWLFVHFGTPQWDWYGLCFVYHISPSIDYLIRYCYELVMASIDWY